jgi:hypothetical protein
MARRSFQDGTERPDLGHPTLMPSLDGIDVGQLVHVLLCLIRCLSLHVKAFQAVIAWWEDVIDSEVIGCWQTPRKITPSLRKDGGCYC